RLVSEAFLEDRLLDVGTDPEQARDLASIRHALISWRKASGWLGPASSVRTLLDTCVEPLAKGLGFSTPVDVMQAGNAIAATFRMATGTVALVVTPWGERFDVFWRWSVADAARRSARWCFFFNGTDIRIVDAGRPFARRYVQFSLSDVLDDPRSVSGL